MNDQKITEPQKFVSNIFWVAASNLTVPLVGLITLPAMTRNYTAETYAVWVQSFLVVGLLSFVLNLCLGNAVIRFLASEDNVIKRRRALGAMLWPVLSISSLALLISVVLRQYLSKLLFATPDYAYLVPLIFYWAAMTATYSLLFSYFLARRKIKKWSIFQITLALFQMLIILILAVTEKSLVWIIGSIVAVATIVVIIVFWMIVKEIGWPKPAIEGLKGYLAFSIPLLPSGILFWAISFSDRFFITYLLNLSQAGIYAASFSIGNLIFLFYSPIAVMLLPVLSNLWEQQEISKVRNYLKYSNKLFITLAIPGAAGLYILSQPLLGIFTTPDYVAGGSLVLLIAVAAILNGMYQINLCVILLARQTKWLVPVITIAAVANIGFNLALIPIFGITGAAIAAVISYLILAATVMVWARKVISYTMSFEFLAKVIAGALLMTLCISFINIGGVLGIVTAVVAGVVIFGSWMWITRAFSSVDIELIKEIILGLKQGALLK